MRKTNDSHSKTIRISLRLKYSANTADLVAAGMSGDADRPNLYSYGLELPATNNKGMPMDSRAFLASSTFMLTGTLPNLSRSQAQGLIEAAGAKG